MIKIKMQKEKKLIRVNKSLISSNEKKLIDWLLPRIPFYITPDILTAIGFIGAIIAAIGYITSIFSLYFLLLANLGLFIHWFGDSLDGNLARYRKIERPFYGFFLDQTVDCLSDLIIILGLGLSSMVSMVAALAALISYHMLGMYNLVITNISGEFHVALLGSGPTEIRIALFLINIIVIIFGAPKFILLGFDISWVDCALVLFSLISIIIFIILVLKEAAILRKTDNE